jgi:hypothetical protein
MIAIETTTEFNYSKRNPSLLGRIRIEVLGVMRNHKLRQYELQIKDWVIYKYDTTVPVFVEQEIEVPVYDEEGNETGETTVEIQQVQNGTEVVQRDGIKPNPDREKMFIYPVPYEQALQLEQAVLAYFPPDPSIQGGDLRDYITKYGLYLLTTQFDEVPTYDIPAENWVIL